MAQPRPFGPHFLRYGLLIKSLATILFVFFVMAAAWPKDVPLNAVVLFDSPNGPAYIQITGLTINGKTDLRSCDGTGRIGKKNYGKLPKVSLRGAKSLERGSDGVLTLLADAAPVCVVPGNLNFDNKPELTPADAAALATIQGTIVSASGAKSGEIPQFKAEVRLIFVAAPDVEFAEYLLAQRANSVEGWKQYLGRYASSSHASEAKTNLATLYARAGESALAAYRKTLANRAPDLAQLKKAQQLGDQSFATINGFPAGFSVLEQVQKELAALVEADRARLQSYRQAFNAHQAGYSNLIDAQKHNALVLEVNPQFDPALSIKRELDAEASTIHSVLKSAETLAGNKNFDAAYKILNPYLAFAGEVPLIRSIIDSTYDYHFGRGKASEEQHNWDEALAEYRKAILIKPGSEAADALKNAENQLIASRNHEAVEKALNASKSYGEQKDFINAYLALDNLPEEQRVLVENERSALRQDVVSAAFDRAKKLWDLHIPIKGRADEDSIRTAYSLLHRAATFSDETNLKLKLDFLADKLSAYYLAQAKRYLEKPNASGIGLGWYYLDAAKLYKPDLDLIRDEKNRYQPQFRVRSNLSIAIEFRDQTSQGVAGGFANQLGDAIANILESSGIVVSRKDAPFPIPPNYVIIGEILQDRVVTDPHVDTLQSKFRSVPHMEQNKDWVKANRELEMANLEQKDADQKLSSAIARNKKKEIDDARTALAAANKKVDDARNRRDSLEPQIQVDTILPYNYTKVTYIQRPTVELGFRITDASGKMVESPVILPKEGTKTYIILEGVKAEDTEGIRAGEKMPPDSQFREELEIQARNELVKLVKEKVAALPQKILVEARRRAKENDLDGAAEEYILYLNSTAPDAPSRDEATGFLQEKFNVGPMASIS